MTPPAHDARMSSIRAALPEGRITLLDRQRLDPVASLRAGEPTRTDATVVLDVLAASAEPHGTAIVVGTANAEAWRERGWRVWHLTGAGESIEWVAIRKTALDLAAAIRFATTHAEPAVDWVVAGGIAGVGAAIALGASLRGTHAPASLEAEMLDDFTHGDAFHTELTETITPRVTGIALSDLDGAAAWWPRLHLNGFHAKAELSTATEDAVGRSVFDALTHADRRWWIADTGEPEPFRGRLAAEARALPKIDAIEDEPWRYDGWGAAAGAIAQRWWPGRRRPAGDVVAGGGMPSNAAARDRSATPSPRRT